MLEWRSQYCPTGAGIHWVFLVGGGATKQVATVGGVAELEEGVHTLASPNLPLTELSESEKMWSASLDL